MKVNYINLPGGFTRLYPGPDFGINLKKMSKNP
jgi:hypothetical protein